MSISNEHQLPLCCQRLDDNLKPTQNWYREDNINYQVLICKECKRRYIQINNCVVEVVFNQDKQKFEKCDQTVVS